MTPGARVQTAIDLFHRIETARVPVDVVVDGFFRGKRFVGAKDRRAITERIFGGLRRRARLDWWIGRALGTTAVPMTGERVARARAIADLMLCERIPGDELSALFNGSRHCPNPLSGEETALVATLDGQVLDHPEMPLWVAHEYPGFLDSALKGLWGDDLARQMNGLNAPATLDLRINTLKTKRDQARAALIAEGIESEPTPHSPIGLRATRRLRLGGIDAFRSGLVEVQDEGSQLVALLVDARPSMAVVDYCAGAGGKALALAAGMNNSGTIIACDVSDKRLERITERVQRAGVRNIDFRVLDPDRGAGLTLKQPADRVLLDVPCSGSGTWRRNPAAKWLLTPGGLERLMLRQRQILSAARRLVRPGGRIVYATCSVLPGENEEPVAAFLEAAPEFRLLPIPEVWKTVLGTACPTNNPYLRLTPADHGTDGFFVAVLERKGAPS